MPRVEFNGRRYRFLSKGKNLCLRLNEAMLSAVFVKTACCGDLNEIYFTDNNWGGYRYGITNS